MTNDMEHMRRKWSPVYDPDDGSWSIQEDRPNGFFICNICHVLPNDETGERTARAICDAHNKKLTGGIAAEEKR